MKKHPCIGSFLANRVLAPFCPIVKPIFRKLFRVEVMGLENVPSEACIVASNHRSHLDPPVLNSVFPEPLIFIAKEELFRVPILGKLLPHMGAIPVKRGSGDLQALEVSLELLERGCKLCIFPEGSRANPGEFLRPRLGVGILAIRSKKKVLPVYIEGADKVLPRGKSFPKLGHPIKVVIGTPKDYSSETDYRGVAQKIMEEIKALSRL
ncbi:lysophospholipid acyltransferase family protein [Thermocrinis sp.]